MAQHEMIGIFPSTIVINEPPIQVIRVPLDNRSAKLRDMAQPQNHSSRDRGNQLKINPTSRTRRGNKR